MKRVALTAMLACLAALPACSSSTGTTTSNRATQSSAPSPGALSEVAREAARPDPNFDYGFTVQITAGGFRPRWLVAVCCQTLTWKNLTDGTVSVVFDHLLVDSGAIPPGGTFTFTPKNVESIAYHAGANPSMRAVVQINQSFEG